MNEAIEELKAAFSKEPEALALIEKGDWAELRIFVSWNDHSITRAQHAAMFSLEQALERQTRGAKNVDGLKEAFAGNDHVLSLIQGQKWNLVANYVESQGSDQQRNAWKPIGDELLQTSMI